MINELDYPVNASVHKLALYKSNAIPDKGFYDEIHSTELGSKLIGQSIGKEMLSLFRQIN